MIPELGQLALILALLLAFAQAFLPLAGVALGKPAWAATARPVAIGQFLFVFLAWAALAASFVNHDFSVANVAQHSNLRLPAHYRLAASWGSHEGSMLLWALMLGGWTAAVALLSRHLPESRFLNTELEHVGRLAKERAAVVVPIFLDSEGLSLAPAELKERLGIFRDDERSWDDIARRLVRQLRSR